jgi:hypothetical protein
METRSRLPSAVALAGAGREHRRREQSESIGCRCAHDLSHYYRSTACHCDRDGALRQIDSITSAARQSRGIEAVLYSLLQKSRLSYTSERENLATEAKQMDCIM